MNALRGRDLDGYLVEIVGSSLRHSFRTPLSIIVNALREVESELKLRQYGDLARYNELVALCKEVYDLRGAALKRYQDIGNYVREKRDNLELDEIGSLLHKDVAPILEQVKKRVTRVKMSTVSLKSAPVDEFCIIAEQEAGRSLRIFEGILLILSVRKSLELKENVVLWGRIDVAVAQVKRNFELSPDQRRRIITPKSSPSVSSSRALIDLLFLNLLENAVRYALRANIFSVQVKISEISSETIRGLYPEYAKSSEIVGTWAEIEIFNTGQSVPDGKDDEIFSLYYTTEKPSDRPTGGGSGVGLALVKIIAELHSGFVFLNRTIKAGTTFTVLLPCLPSS